MNGQSSRWLPVTAGWSASRIHFKAPPFLNIYKWVIQMTSVINLSSKAKLFADDTSLFSVVNDINLSEFHLNIDLALEIVLKHFILQSFIMISQ